MFERDRKPTRRDVLRTAALAGATAPLLPGVALSRELSPLVQGRKTKRVVLIAFSGGVRTRETFGSVDNVPNMVRMGREGVVLPRMRTSNLGHFGASMSIFTGISEPRGIRDNQRGPDPTIFEYLRKDLGLAQGDVWVTTSGGAQQTNYSYGLHPDYGSRYGATILDGDGIFNAEFKGLMDEFGRPRPSTESEAELLARLRQGLGGDEDERNDRRKHQVAGQHIRKQTNGKHKVFNHQADDFNHKDHRLEWNRECDRQIHMGHLSRPESDDAELLATGKNHHAQND